MRSSVFRRRPTPISTKCGTRPRSSTSSNRATRERDVVGARAPLTVLLFAGGQGTRLKSKTIKLLHPVAGQPMATWVARATGNLRPARTIAVVGFQGDDVRAALSGLCDAFAIQTEQRGTGH